MTDPYRPQQYDVIQPNGQPLAPPPPVGPPPYPPPAAYAPPGPRRRKRRPVLVVLGVAGAITVALCGAIAIAAGINSSSDRPAAGSSPATAAAGSSAATAILAWWNGGGSALVDKLGADFAALHDSSANKTGDAQKTAVRAGCTQIEHDAKSAQGYQSIPDQQAQASWSKALGLYVQGATDCITGIDRTDTPLVTKAADEIHQGNDALNAVSDRVQQLGG